MFSSVPTVILYYCLLFLSACTLKFEHVRAFYAENKSSFQSYRKRFNSKDKECDSFGIKIPQIFAEEITGK